jgi:3-oxoacyl-[acyl-carrier protein] reductase
MEISSFRGIVTGAAGGLGREMCLSLAREGAQVAAFDNNAAGLAQLASDANANGLTLRTYTANVAKQDDVVAAVKRAAADLGGINGLINNAGIYRDGLLVRTLPGSAAVLKFPLSQWQAVLDVDLTGPFLMAREVAAQAIERKIRPAVIINISSVSRAGFAGQSNYAAAKAGVVSDAQVWARELAPHGIRVAALAPGFIRTAILDAMDPPTLERRIASIPQGRLGEPSEIYQGIRFIIECDYFNASCLDIHGGLSGGAD